ncbi:two-component system, sensor histidine kinase YesM [Paenibacillus algorifonticola]|uniref:Two-component system, sensor histidine kinase YesM n=1 Tax=Paenibacillus algorifonticola TaxID=684063 RepID=A0A1I2EV84_9BACL|nr:sensor histidine kinase [Paenibacillus algorifonticola]SFE96765.1 two-component system, sensor histidine kinase YesM [Paenibacillus algorifonticola]
MSSQWLSLLRLRSFRHRLMVAAIVCLLLPALITLAVYNMLTKDAMKQEAVTQSQQKLELVDGYVSNLFNYMFYIANNVQLDSEMNRIMKAIASGKTYEGASAEYDRYLDRMKIMNKIENMTVVGDKAYVTILLKDGTNFANYSIDEYNPGLFREEPWFAQLSGLSGLQSFWPGATPTVFDSDKVRSPYQLSIARALRGDSVNPYGYVIVTILENKVSDIFRKIELEQETMLLSSEDQILSHPDAKRVGEIFPYATLASDQADPHILQIEKEDYLMAWHTNSLTGWKLVSLTPYDRAVFKLNVIFKRVFMFQLVSFCLFMVLLLYLLGKFTRPLVRLGRVAETVQRGNLEVRSGIRGEDEIGYLGQSFDLMLDKVKETIGEITKTQVRKRKAELAMLQAQINPHFLFNVLNSIRMKVLRKGDSESAEMISSLSKLLRMTISQDKGVIPLHEEVDLAIDYVRLMNMRQKEKAELTLDLSPLSLTALVPRFCLQPIIENALIHGLSQQAGLMMISASEAEGGYQITVSDSGQGIEKGKLERLRHKLGAGSLEKLEQGAVGEEEGDAGALPGKFSGIGLVNVYERMGITYGERFQMTIDSDIGQGTVITLYIPKQVVDSDG